MILRSYFFALVLFCGHGWRRVDIRFKKCYTENAKAEVERSFPQEAELSQKMKRLAELNALLDMDHKDNEIVYGEIAARVEVKDKERT